jgi:hypothetical protein
MGPPDRWRRGHKGGCSPDPVCAPLPVRRKAPDAAGAVIADVLDVPTDAFDLETWPWAPRRPSGLTCGLTGPSTRAPLSGRSNAFSLVPHPGTAVPPWSRYDRHRLARWGRRTGLTQREPSSPHRGLQHGSEGPSAARRGWTATVTQDLAPNNRAEVRTPRRTKWTTGASSCLWVGES